MLFGVRCLMLKVVSRRFTPDIQVKTFFINIRERYQNFRSSVCFRRMILRRYWWPRAEEAWRMQTKVAAALEGLRWDAVLKAVKCQGAGVFGGLQLAKALPVYIPSFLKMFGFDMY